MDTENTEVEEIQALGKIWSKKGCRWCCERGYLIFDMVDRNNPRQKYIKQCYCVKKNMKKYNQEK